MSIKRIASIDDLNTVRDEVRAAEEKLTQDAKRRILVCTGGGCLASGSLKVKGALEEQLKSAKLSDKAVVLETGCMGPCAQGPVVLIAPDQVFYQDVKPEDAAEIVGEHIAKGNVVERLVHHGTADGSPKPLQSDIVFFQKQTKVVLRNCGIIDPGRLDHYIARDGYQGLAKAVTAKSPEEVIEEAKKSGLRGRGGAGFPTWLKWSLTRKSPGDEKFVLCNADEGDPGAFMDRSVLEGDPHSVIEGMAIAAYAIGASQGYIYVRAEYPLAVERLEAALDAARKVGLLGKNIIGSSFSFDLEVRMGSGAFVCGEETALMTSIEGNRGEPRPRPPFPAVKGLWDKPSVLNNVETYANIGAILDRGAEWYASYGTEKSKGTKVFALAGSVNNTGLVEVPVGTTLGELIYDVGGGIRKGKQFKAAQIGGPSGGCVPKQHLNVPLDYESLAELGAIMGSGGLIVMDEDACMVDVARFFLEFVQEESCGKCVPCRVGTKRMLEILERICDGRGEMADIQRLIDLGRSIKDTALCGLGQTAPNPVLSTIRHFRQEYEEHILCGHCEAGVCAGLVRAPCLSGCPAGVNVPGFVSLVGEKRYGDALQLHRERNPFAAVCARVCFHPCESKCRRSTLDDAVSIRGVKRFMVDQESAPHVPEVHENEANAKRPIAIVGAGPAGLSCAYFLARMGYKPTVFEAEEKLGGMLVQTIPAYRLPRTQLGREIDMIRGLGVTIETGKKLGRDFTLASLKDDGYEAAFIGVGAQSAMKLGVPGDDQKGVVDALAFLRQYNMTGSAAVGKNVAVIGGGNAAVDAARTAMRLGAESVTIYYRRTREEMPAWTEEIMEAEKEGVVLRELVTPVEVVAENGAVARMVMRPMQLGQFDRSGRRRPEGEEGKEFTVEVDQVIAAIGQRVSLDEVFNGVELEQTDWRTIAVDPVSGQSSVPWVFAGGDAVSGPSSVVEAVGAGERAAVGMDEYLTGEKHAFWREYAEVDTPFDPDADPLMHPRAELEVIEVTKRHGNFEEVETVWKESVAIAQAKRCLRCDYGKQQG